MSIRFKFFLLFIVIITVTCSDDSNHIIKGEWKGVKNNYRVILNDDYNYVQLFGKPWLGSVKFDEAEVDLGELELLIDNVLGQLHFCSNVICFHFYSNSFTFYYQENEYTFEGSYQIDLQRGEFTAEGIGRSDNNTIDVNLRLNAQKTKLLKETEYSIHDGLSHEKNLYRELYFGKENYLKGEIIFLDILFDFKGEYSVKSNKLSLDFDIGIYDHDAIHEYTFKLVKSDTLKLYESIDYLENDISLNIPNEIINTLQYERVFKRE